MKKVLAIVLALMMLVPMALAIVPASAVDNGPEYLDLTQRFNTRSYTVGSGFLFDGNYTAKKNTATTAAGSANTLQYAGNIAYDKTDYTLSYDVKLSADNTGETMNFLYWQDYGTLANGNIRSFASEKKAVGAGLYATYTSTGVSYLFLTYADGTFANSKGQIRDGSDPLSNTSLYANAPANMELHYEIDFNLAAKTVDIVVSRKDDPTISTTILLDISGSSDALDDVVNPQGWAFSDYKSATTSAVESVGNFKIDGGDPVLVVQGFNCYNYTAVTGGFAANSTAPLSVTNSAKAGNEVIEFLGGTHNAKDYEFSYEVELNSASATYTHFYWQKWGAYNAASNRTYPSEGKSVGAILTTTVGSGTPTGGSEPAPNVTFGVLGYGANTNYSASLKGVVAQDSDPATNYELVAGIDEGAVKLLIGYDFDYAAKKLDVVISRVDDPTVSTNVVFDLTNTFPALEAVTEAAPIAITDASAEGSEVSSIGNVIYNKNGGVVGATELTEPAWSYNGDIDINTDDWTVMIPKAINYEEFSVSDDGYFTRTGTESATTTDAYVAAQWNGKFNSDDYKLQFNLRANAENTFRFYTYVAWDNVDYWGQQKANGYYVRVQTYEGKVSLACCYATDGRYKGTLSPTPETAGNAIEADAVILAGQDPNAELVVTIVVIGTQIQVSAALASDPTKTTGNVIFNMDDQPGALASVDRENESIMFLDGACESAYNPASVGNVKLWALEAPTVPTPVNTGTSGTTPSENQTPGGGTTAATTTAATTTAAPEATDKPAETIAAEEEGGCKSSITVASFAALATVAVSAVVVTKKRKED